MSHPRLCLIDEVTWDGRPVAGERTRTLLTALADAGARGLSESAMVEAIWDDDVPANPAKAVQVVVSRARTATAAEAIERTARGYRLALSPSDVDVWSERPEALRLAGEGHFAEALPRLERLDRDDEVMLALLRAVAAVQGVPSALKRYEEYLSRIADQLGIDPGPALQSLHRELLARDSPVRTGLRYDATELLGRDEAVHDVTALLQRSRVVTILGPGGLGKTRLAQLLAREAEQPVVHVVELVGVTAPEAVVEEVGSVLGVRDSIAGRKLLSPAERADVRARIAQNLAQAPTLLVLDNCEHVIDAAADLAAFLVATVSDLTILTTSRTPLSIGAEAVYPLAQLAQVDGVRLFEERARAVRPDVALPRDVVTEIVARLDGLPLAIELAAVKVRAMAVDDIARRLGNRFELLTDGVRGAPDRHQTLLAVIDWSWNLLGERERRAMRWLSLFHDGFTLDAAEEVLGPDALAAVAELTDQSLLTVVEAKGSVRYRMLETIREFGRMQLVDAREEADAARAQRAWAVGYADQHSNRLYTPDQVDAMDAIRTEETNLADVLREVLGEPDREAVVTLTAALGGFWAISGNHPRVVIVADSLGEALEGWQPPAQLLDRTRLAVAIALFAGTIVGAPGTNRLRAMLEAIGTDASFPPLRAVLITVLAFSGEGGLGFTGTVNPAVDSLINDPDPRVQAIGWQCRCHELENSGNPAKAIDAGERALELVDDRYGPWLAGNLHGQLCGLHAQFGGDLAKAAEHASAAVTVMEALGAEDDLLQMRTILAMRELALGNLDRAEVMIDELVARTAFDQRGPFGTTGAITAVRAELALARGHTDRGLQLYRDSVTAMAELPRAFLGPNEATPWLIFAEAMAVVAFARLGDGDDGVDLVRSLVNRAAKALEQENGYLDYPVAGLAMFGIGLWGLCKESMGPDDAIRSIVIAHRFAYYRGGSLMAWEDAAEVAERVAPGVLDDVEAEYDERRGPALLDEARVVVSAAVDHILRE